jgi:glycogen operon protein
MQRIDVYPTHRHGNFLLRAGRPFPFGATFVPGGINFAIFSHHASACTLVLFERGARSPLAEIPFPDAFRIGSVFAMVVFDLNPEEIEYGYRMHGPYKPIEGHRFDPHKILLDPYAKAIGGRDEWGRPPDRRNPYQHRARLVSDDFDWLSDRPLETPIEDLVIYEMHVRGFTRHPSSGVKYPGTYAAVREKIPYLKELGVNAVELMPIHEFDEFDNRFVNPRTGQRLLNYWGYSTIGFFAPKAGFAATGKHGMQVDELKALVKELHKNGIEIILDVVFNHTAEGNEDGPTMAYRGIDNKTYYMVRPDGRYYNFSGCGNTMNCNHPVVRNMVLECLRYWAAEYHIDGFRFDLASILGRDARGNPLSNPPLLESLAGDPILSKCKLIAEAWDAGGLYQVGTFPAYGRWAEWNGKYRDTIRKYLKGDMGQLPEVAARLQGSPDLYSGRGSAASINFITAHDGFTLADLVAYNDKHNWANGENNSDGSNENHSWNCGWEGPTNDMATLNLRRRQMKNALAMLIVSQGIPMILMGDEIGRTQGGNNNAYCQDNETSWLDWSFKEKNSDLFRFCQNLIAFRKAHPILRNPRHFTGQDTAGSGYADLTWHGVDAWNVDWEFPSRCLAMMLDGSQLPGRPDGMLYIAMNMHWEDHTFELPGLPDGCRWHLFADTALQPPTDCYQPGQEPLLNNQRKIRLTGRSVIILVGK